MAVSDYTTNDEIRAVLGVSEDELEDTTLDLPIYGLQLNTALFKVYSGLSGIYKTVSETPEEDRTASEQRLYDSTRIYAAYKLGRILLGSLKMFAPQKITDGKGEQNRFSDPFEIMRGDFDTMLNDVEDIIWGILEEDGIVRPAVSTRNILFVAGIGNDPVVATQEGQ